MEVQSAGPPRRSGGNKFRAVMLFLSGLTMLMGLTIFVFGIYIYISKSGLVAGVNLILTVLGVGFLIFLFASFGFCGAYKRSKFWLFLYTCVVLLCIIGEVAVVIMVAVDAFDVDGFLEDRWYELDNDSRVTIQDYFDCCGYPGFYDNIGESCPVSATEGCKVAFEDYVNEVLVVIAIVCGVAVLLQILMVTLGCCLIGSITLEHPL